MTKLNQKQMEAIFEKRLKESFESEKRYKQDFELSKSKYESGGSRIDHMAFLEASIKELLRLQLSRREHCVLKGKECVKMQIESGKYGITMNFLKTGIGVLFAICLYIAEKTGIINMFGK